MPTVRPAIHPGDVPESVEAGNATGNSVAAASGQSKIAHPSTGRVSLSGHRLPWLRGQLEKSNISQFK